MFGESQQFSISLHRHRFFLSEAISLAPFGNQIMTETHTVDPTTLDIVVQSLTLPERLSILRRRPESFTEDRTRAAALKDSWRDKLGLDDIGLLADRFADLGMTEEDLDRLAGTLDVDAIDLADHTPWVDLLDTTLARAVDADSTYLPDRAYFSRRDENPLPFEHAFAAWIDEATDRLARRLESRSASIDPDILRTEQRSLIENLSQLGRDAMSHELRITKLSTYSGNDLALGFLTTTPPTTAYTIAIDHIAGDERRAWWSRHAALARLFAVRCIAWVRSLAEIMEHLGTDRDEIVERFFDGREPGSLVEISRGIADSHNGGRSVAILKFESGARIVYKPRNMSIDEQFVRIVDSVNELIEEDLRLVVPRSWNRDRYGWMEFAEGQPCDDDTMVRRYHRRMGVLLAVVHALQGNDFHLENVMASGANPMPIDLETVSVPEPITANTAVGLVDPAAELVQRSVLRTLLLPSIITRPGIDPQNLGALEVEEQNADGTRSHLRLQGANTDFQRWVKVDGVDPETNAGRIARVERRDGVAVDTMAMMPEISKGYRIAYQSILENRDRLLDPEGPIHGLDSSLVRVLNRSTQIYYRLLLESCQREHLATGVDRWIHLERLSMPLANDPETTKDLPHVESIRAMTHAIIEAEQASLVDGDIAYFVAKGGGTEYMTIDPATAAPRKVVNATLKNSAIESAESQLQRMGASDLELQDRLMNSSYLTAYQTLNEMLHGGTPRDTSISIKDVAGPETSVDELRSQIVSTLEWIESERIPSDVSVNWIESVVNPELDTIQPGPLDMSSYSGRGGIVMLLELAYRALGERHWIELATRAIDIDYRAIGMGLDATSGLNLPPSGLTYRGGLTSSLWMLGRHEGYGEYRDAARRITTEITERSIKNDQAYDALGGCAGQILLLIGMLEEDTIPNVHGVIERMADHLIRSRVDIDGPGWRIAPNQIPVCGFAHGRAGIALALLQAGRLLDRRDLRDAAIAVFEAEHRLRGDQPSEGWPDYRGVGDSDPRPSPGGSPYWCSGLEGIALSRAAALQIEDHPVLRDDLEFCLAGLREAPLSQRHHLCCGIAGRIETDVTLQRLCNTPALIDEASRRRILAQSLDPTALKEHGLNGMALFQGMSGPVWSALGQISGLQSDILLLRI